MAYSVKEWDIVRAFFESGLSLSEIVARKEVAIKDRGGISRRARAEGWIKGKNQHLIDVEVEVKQKVANLEQEKSTKNPTELKVFNTLVDERTKHIQFYADAGVKIAMSALKALDDDERPNVFEHKALAETVLRSKEITLGKEVAPAAAIQINNHGETQQAIAAANITLDAFRQEARRLQDEF